MISDLAPCSSSFTFSRTIEMILVVPCTLLLAGSISKRTTLPASPRIKSTTSSKRQPTTSTNGSLPCPTAMILSSTAISPVLSAGPLLTKEEI